MEFYFLLISKILYKCVRLRVDLPDTDNIVSFENTTPVNQNWKGKIKERRTDWSDYSK